jgi:hypothetical protein
MKYGDLEKALFELMDDMIEKLYLEDVREKDYSDTG